MLHSAGCQMLEASDAETGIALAAKEQPDLIFLDIVLPGISGFTALRTLRYDVRTLHIPVILMTGNKSAASQLLRTRLDIEDLLIKPFSRRDVFLRIERLLDVHLIPRRKPRRASGRRKKPRKNEPRS